MKKNKMILNKTMKDTEKVNFTASILESEKNKEKFKMKFPTYSAELEIQAKDVYCRFEGALKKMHSKGMRSKKSTL